MTQSTTDPSLKILVVVYDDTTIFMAESFLRECEARGLRTTLGLVYSTDRVYFEIEPGVFQKRRLLRPHVSERQIAALRERAKDFVVIGDQELGKAAALYDVVLLSKLPKRAVSALEELERGGACGGPVLVAFSSGLDSSPRHTLLNRSYADILQANSPAHLERLRKAAPALWRPPTFGVGHPFFARRKPLTLPRWEQIKTIYFLHQSIWPSNPVTRREVYRFIQELALAHPDKHIKLKLRHLPQENRDNVNQEKYPPSEYWGGQQLPANLSFDTRSFSETLESADLYVSLSSSGIVEGLVHGKLGLFVEGFPGEEQDEESRQIISQFRGSGLVVDRVELLAGRLPAVNTQELDRQVAHADYFDELLDACRALRQSKKFRARVNRAPLLLRARRTAGTVARRLRKSMMGP
jgi:hypothetical protein